MKPPIRHLITAGLALAFVVHEPFNLTAGTHAKDQALIPYGDGLDVTKPEADALAGSTGIGSRSGRAGGAAHVAFTLDRIALPDLGPPGPLAPGANIRRPGPPIPPGPPPFPLPGAIPTFAGPPFPPIGLDRASCDESIDRHAAMTGYIGSKLRLQAGQRDAWQKIEQAAEPAIEKMRQICASLPAEPGPPPSFPTTIGIVEKQLTAQAELLHAIAGPVQALYDTLSPDQRAVLDRPPRF